MGRSLKELFILFIFFISIFNVLKSQNPDYSIVLKGIAEETVYPAREVSVKLYESDKVIKEIITKSDGKFEFQLDTGKNYVIVISKTGYLTKKLAFDTKVPNGMTAKWTNEFAVTMIKKCGNVDISALNDPIDKIKFHSRTESFKSDQEYSRKMFKKLDAIYYELSNCHFEKYNELLNKAEKAQKENRLSDAKEYYQEATEMMPSEDYARKKMYEVIDELKESNLDNDSFERLKKEGDKLFAQEKFKEALEVYDKAYEINNNDSDLILKMNTSRQKVHEALIAQNKEQMAAQQDAQKKEEQFNALVAKGDDSYRNKDYSIAREAYNQALALKSNDENVKAKINKIDQLVAQQNADNELAAKKQNEDKYRSLITEASLLQSQNNYQQAKQKYQEALTVKENDPLSLQKIAELNRLIATQEQNQLALQEKNKKYSQLIQDGNNLMNNGELELAKQKFEQAAQVNPGDVLASTKINQINQKIAEQNKLTEKKEKDKQYTDLINQANNLLTLGELEQAKQLLQKASLLKPGDTFASAKINEVNQKIQQEKQKELAEEQKRIADKQKEAQFQQYVNKANSLRQANQLELAIAEFQKALNLKPNDVSVKNNIQQIDQQMQQQALAEKQQREKELAYNNTIKSADKMLAMGELEQAKTLYQNALNSKPGDTYASSKITEVNVALNKKQQEDLARTAKENQYNQSITKADGFMQNGDLASAKLEYQKALNVKPGDQLAINKIKEVDRLSQQKQQQKQLAQQQEQKYNNLVTQADQLYTKKDYENALGLYQQASAIKPSETHPVERINELNSLIADNNKTEKNKQDYENALKLGNSYFNKGDMANAKIQYQKALALQPGSTYATQQLTKINQGLSLAASNANTSGSSAKSALQELKFKSDDERDRYLTQLTRKYPAGITLEVYKEEFQTTNRYIVIRDGKANEYREVIHSWGGKDYSLNDKATNSMYFKQQTKQKSGEYFKKFEMK